MSKSQLRTADFRIDERNPRYGDKPYTLQPGECGEPGLYVHFTPEYLLNIRNTSDKFGPPGTYFIYVVSRSVTQLELFFG